MGVISINLNSPHLKKHARLYAETVRSILHALVMVNRIALRSDRNKHQIPPLYKAGVRYAREPRGSEVFQDLHGIIATKTGDCEDLAAWRVAELQEAGENARIRVKWVVTRRGPRIFHILVRRGDGREEDPSKILGMKGSR